MASSLLEAVGVGEVQAVGILFGCSVFGATILTVGLLLLFGGSFDRMRLEAEAGPQPVVLDTKPKVVEHLLARAEELPVKPCMFGEAGDRIARDVDGVEVIVREASASDDFEAIADGSARLGEASYDRRSVWRDPFVFDDAEGDDETRLAVLDARGAQPRLVGALRLEHNRPTHLGITLQLEWMHPAYSPHVANAPSASAAKLAIFEACAKLFDTGYRRVETYVSTDDAPRKALFESMGFCLEGVLRKHMIVNERSRDTTVYSLLNTEWNENRLLAKLGLKLHPL